MSGNIEKRGPGVYRLRISRGKDPATGKRLAPFRLTMHGSRKEADKKLRDLIQELEGTGSITKTPVETLSEYLGKWIRSVAAMSVKPRTLQSHQECIARYLDNPLGKLLLAQVTTARIQEHYAHLIKDRKLSVGTVRRAHAVLSSALKVAVQQSLLAQNPALSVTLPRGAGKPQMRVFNTDEGQAFIKALDQERYGLFFEILLFGGLRPGEAAGLFWDCVDFNNNTLRIERSLIWLKNGQWEIGTPKTAKSRRSVPLPPSVLERLKIHRIEQRSERSQITDDAECSNQFVFCSDNGTPLNLSNLRKRHFIPILKKAGLRPEEFKGLYSMRHSCASLLLTGNTHPKIVSERLGHSTTQLTMDTYSHLTGNMQQGATENCSPCPVQLPLCPTPLLTPLK